MVWLDDDEKTAIFRLFFFSDLLHFLVAALRPSLFLPPPPAIATKEALLLVFHAQVRPKRRRGDRLHFGNLFGQAQGRPALPLVAALPVAREGGEDAALPAQTASCTPRRCSTLRASPPPRRPCWRGAAETSSGGGGVDAEGRVEGARRRGVTALSAVPAVVFDLAAENEGKRNDGKGERRRRAGGRERERRR